MIAVFSEVDAFLRAEGRHRVGGRRLAVPQMFVLLVTGAALFGAAVGSWSLDPWQVLFSALKFPLLLVVTTVVCLPNFFVVNTLLGLRQDFAAASRGIVAAQATGAVCLASLAPLTLFTYASSDNYDLALVFNGGMFLLATVAAQITLSKHYAPLIAADPRHRIGRSAWGVLYVFVAIQLAWVLRPFVGSPGLPTRFFREEAWDNAYVVVAQKVWSLITGG